MLKWENKKINDKIKGILVTNDKLNTLKERMGELEKKFEQFEKNNKEEMKKRKKINLKFLKML